MTPGRTRRAVDVVLAGAGLVMLAPLGLAIGAAISACSGWPVLFRQRRCGLRGQEFVILKFRTMSPLRRPGQPDLERQTRLGSVLRATSLDELPQLVNILKGDMSFIGPRPTLPEQVCLYTPRQYGRLAIRPGLTGWAQVCGRNSLSWPRRIDLDLWYIENRCWRLDLRIIARTAARLLWPRDVVGAGGVNPGLAAPSSAADREVHHAS
jgi:lipopolysaccharide/colanic/teichoic acid biosynthesis glycosyltransferase